MKRLTGLAIVAVSTAFVGSSVNAATVRLESVLANGSDFTFNYGGTLGPTEGVKSGSKLVIFDFDGYVAGSIKSTSPNVSAKVENLTSDVLLPPGRTDNPSEPNLVFTYTGPDFQTTPATPPGTFYPPLHFEGFSASSIFGATTLGPFGGVTVNNFSDAAGTPVFSAGLVGVPEIPEVGTWGMMLIGFGAIGFAMRNRRAAHISFA
jgi:hypothetical protein